MGVKKSSSRIPSHLTGGLGLVPEVEKKVDPFHSVLERRERGLFGTSCLLTCSDPGPLDSLRGNKSGVVKPQERPLHVDLV